jgi:hypothetical protein
MLLFFLDCHLNKNAKLNFTGCHVKRRLDFRNS